MSLSTANRTGLFYVKEVTWGTTPTSPALQQLRYTGEQLSDEKSFEKSKEIRSDRMLADTILVDSSPKGSFNIEMSATSFDSMMEAALMSAWSSQLNIVGVAADIESTATGFESSTSGKFTNVVVGQWIRASGFTSAVNGYYLVTAKTGSTIIDTSPAPGALETPALALAHIDGSMVRNGTTEQSYTLVKEFNDTTAVTREVYRGQRVKTLSLDLKTGSILTGSIGFVGKSGEYTESLISGETKVATTSTDVMNCVNDVQNLTRDGTAVASGRVMSLTFELDNQHREQKGIGVLGNVGVVAGQLLVNSNASQYFEDKTEADRFGAATAFSFSFRLEDSAGNSYIITIPRAKYEQFKTNAAQLDSDVMAETQFTATRDPATNCMVQIDRFLA